MIIIRDRKYCDQQTGLQYLTDKQRETLEAIAGKAPDYTFEVLCYEDCRPRILVWEDGHLMGSVCCISGVRTYIPSAGAVIRRIARCIYRMRVR